MFHDRHSNKENLIEDIQYVHNIGELLTDNYNLSNSNIEICFERGNEEQGKTLIIII